MNTTTLDASDSDLPAERLLRASRPLVIGHRGFSQVAPENTLSAFKLAMAAGADLVELDYYHSKEGVPVVFHDKTLDRTTDAVKKWGHRGLKPSDKTVEELKALDAGGWFSPHYAGQQIPLLTEALDVIQSDNVTLIERKEGEAATCVALLRERGLVNKVVVQAFDWAYLRDFHEQEPRQVLGALGPPSSRNGKKLTDAEKALNADWIDEASKSGARVVGWNKQVSRESVAEAHARGLKVWIYTINDIETANQLLDMGVDGIITDNPAVIWKALAQRISPAGR